MFFMGRLLDIQARLFFLDPDSEPFELDQKNLKL